MAKRKKLNKRLLVVLGIIAAICAGGLLVMFGMPQDPAAWERRGDEALKAGDYRQAEEAFVQAVTATKTNDSVRSDRCFKLADCLWQSALKTTTLTDSQRSEKQGQALQGLRQIIQNDPSHLASQRMLQDIYWLICSSSRQPMWKDYLREADAQLKLEPQNSDIYFRRAIANGSLAEADFLTYGDKAVDDFRKAIELKPGSIDYRLALATFYYRTEKKEQAEAAFQELTALNPDSARAHIAYAHFLTTQNRKAQALEQIQEACKREPTSPLGQLALANLYVQDNKLDEALEALRAARKISNTEWSVYRDMAMVYSRQRKPDKAIASLREGLAAVQAQLAQLATSQPGAEQNRLADTRFRLTYLLANTLLDQCGMVDKPSPETLKEIEGLLDQLGDQGDSVERNKIKGRLALLTGHSDEGAKLLEKVYKDSNNTETQVAAILVNIYLKQGRPGPAEKLLDELMQLPGNSRNAPVLLLKARILMHYRNYEQATKYVTLALQAEPDNAEALATAAELAAYNTDSVPGSKLSSQGVRFKVEQAMTLWGSGQTDKAVQLLEEINAKTPGNLAVLQQLVSFYASLKQTDKALALLEQAKKDRPEIAPKLELQQRLVQEPSAQKRFELLVAEADKNPDPLARAIEKCNIAATFGLNKELESFLQEAEKLSPDSPVVIDRRLRLAISREDWTTAETYAQRGAKANIDSLGGRTLLLKIALSKKDYAKAISLLNDLLKDQPNNKIFQTSLGECYLAQSKLEDADKAFQAVIRNDPGFAQAVVGMAHVTELQGRTQEHADYVEQASRMAPNDPYIRERLLALREERAKPEDILAKIIPAREQQLARQPDDLQNCFRLGILYERTGQLTKAEKMFRTCYEKHANSLIGGRLLMTFLARNNRFADVTTVKDDLLQRVADKVAVYVMYAEFMAVSQPDVAMAVLDKAIAQDPKDPRGYYGKARIFAAQQQWVEAARAMEDYLKLRPDRAAEKDLIRFCIEAGQNDPSRYDAASARLDRMNDPSDVEVMMLRGVLAMRKRDLKKAEELLDRAVQMDPDSPVALLNLAQLYVEQNDLSRARANLEKAKSLTNNPQVALSLAQLYVAMQNTDDAQLVYEEILARRKDFAPALKGLISLYITKKSWTPLENLLESAKKLYPSNVEWYLLEEEVAARRGNQTKRMAAMEAVCKLQPDNSTLFARYMGILLENKQYKKVLDLTQAALTPAAVAANPNMMLIAKALRASALYKSNSLAEADALFAEAVKEAPPILLGPVLKQIYNCYGAEKALPKCHGWVMQYHGDNWRAISELAAMYIQSDVAKAIEVAAMARQKAQQPSDKAIMDAQLGTLYQQRRDLANAEKAYLESLKYVPPDTKDRNSSNDLAYLRSLNNLAYLYVQNLDQPEKALPYAEKAYRLVPDDPNVLDTYGWVLARLGRLADAEAPLQRAQTMASSAEGHYHLGYLYEKTNRLNDAEKQYRLAAELVRVDQEAASLALAKLIDDSLARIRQK